MRGAVKAAAAACRGLSLPQENIREFALALGRHHGILIRPVRR